MAAPRRAPLRDSKSTLYEAAIAAVKSQHDVQSERARSALAPVRRRRARAILVLIGLAGAVLLLLKPSWLAGPRSLPNETPAIAAASLRLELLQGRLRVNTFARTRGRLPASLAEAGVPNPAIHFQSAALAGGFSLWGQAGDSLITLKSTDSLTTFLGKSLRTLKNRGRQ